MGRKALLIAMVIGAFGCKSMTELKAGRCENSTDCKSGESCVAGYCEVPDSGPETLVSLPDTGVVDAEAKKDAAVEADAPVVDAPVVDAAVGDTAIIGCRSASDCLGTGRLCVANVCVECAGAEDCKDPGKSFCVGGSCLGCELAGASACPGKVCAPAGTPDAGGQCVECVTSTTCKGATPVCVGNACVGCTDSEQCKGKSTAKPACLVSTGTCEACATSSDCPETAKLCDPISHTCVGCTSSAGCPAGTPICTEGVCGRCGTSKLCSDRDPATPLCEPTSGACVECSSNVDCKDGSKPNCDPATNKCVGCVGNANCSGATPICDGNVCKSCTTATKTCKDRDAKLPACSGGGSCVECTDKDTAACTGTKNLCNPTTNLCVQCLSNSHCQDTTPICDLKTNTCVACAASTTDCQSKDPKKPACLASGACEQCKDDGNCKEVGKTACNTTSHTCVQCVNNDKCSDTTPICDTAANTCGKCASSQACKDKNAGAPVCLDSGACAECSASDKSACTGTKPICNTSTNTCQPCATDNQCTGIGPGVCITADGHCATTDETLSVSNGSGNWPATAMPSGKNLLLVTGTVLGTLEWDLSGRTQPITIAGQPGGNATIDGNGAVTTVHVTGNGDVFVKNITIRGGAATGLRVDGSSTIHLDRVRVNDNPGGGIAINNAGFDIKNTTVSNNSSTGGEGIRLQSLPASGKPTSLTNVSVTNNLGAGVLCVAATDTPIPASGVLLAGNVTPTTNCTFSAGATCTVASATCGAQ